jgi:hypothetical protein
MHCEVSDGMRHVRRHPALESELADHDGGGTCNWAVTQPA